MERAGVEPAESAGGDFAVGACGVGAVGWRRTLREG